MTRVDLSDAFIAQADYPRGVVEHLRDDIPWGAVAFELDDVQLAFAVDREEVKDAAGIGWHLATDYQHIQAQDRDVLGEPGLQACFVVQTGRGYPTWCAVNVPQLELNRHAGTCPCHPVAPAASPRLPSIAPVPVRR